LLQASFFQEEVLGVHKLQLGAHIWGPVGPRVVVVRSLDFYASVDASLAHTVVEY
jgi:hypothetical protein